MNFQVEDISEMSVGGWEFVPLHFGFFQGTLNFKDWKEIILLESYILMVF